MKNFAKIILVTSAFVIATQGTVAYAAKVTGNVETTVKVENVTQKAVGLANKNEMNIGAITGDSKVGGNVKINVKAKSVEQKAEGLANKNSLNIGSVSE